MSSNAVTLGWEEFRASIYEWGRDTIHNAWMGGKSGGLKHDPEGHTFLPTTALAVYSAGLFRILLSEQPALEQAFTFLSLDDVSNPLATPELYKFFRSLDAAGLKLRSYNSRCKNRHGQWNTKVPPVVSPKEATH